MLKTTLFLVSCFLFFSCDTPKQTINSGTSTTTSNLVQKEVDPIYKASPSATITTLNISNWNSVYGKNTYTQKQTDSDIAANKIGSIDAYTKTQSDALYQLKIPLNVVTDYFAGNQTFRNFNTDVRSAINISGNLSYNSLTGTIGYVQPLNVSAFFNDMKYLQYEKDSIFLKHVASTITQANIDTWNNTYSKEQSNVLFAPFTHFHSIENIVGLQNTLDSKATITQLSDSLIQVNNKYDALSKKVDSIKIITDTLHDKYYIHDTTHINDTVFKAVSASAFDGRNNPYGIGLTTGNVTQKAIDQFGGLLKQVRARFSFSDFDKGIGKQYSYSLLDSAVNLCVTNHLGLMFQVIRSPYDNMPTYLWSAPYSVPIVFTDDPRPTLNRFPYYLNDSFNSRFDAFGVDLARHVFNYKNNQQAALKFCMNSPLSTGDYVAYKGNIIKVTINNIIQSNPQDYALNETQTTTYVHVTLNQLITAFKQNTFLKIAANPDNTARDWDYDISQGITSLKVGELGHTIWNSGEGTIITRLRSLLKLFSDAFFFSENEGTTSSPAWTQQEVLPLCMQGISAGMKSISFANANVSSDSAYYIFNEYAGDTTSGIIYCKDIVDFNDTSRFNTLTFADIIDPLKVSNYNKQVQRINSDPTIPNAQKQEQLSSLLVNNFNQQRIKNIEAAMIPQGYQFAGDSQYHRMDGGIDLYNHGFNYESRLYMSNFSGKGVFRLGDSTWVFGRACLQIDNADIDYESDTIKELSITYFDSDKEIDVFFCNKRFGVIKITIAPTNTKRFMTKIFSLYNYVSKGVSGHDLHVSGSGIVQLIEVH